MTVLDEQRISGSGKYLRPGPVDLSEADLFGVTLRGDAAAQEANTVGIMFADVNDVFFGHDLRGDGAVFECDFLQHARGWVHRRFP